MDLAGKTGNNTPWGQPVQLFLLELGPSRLFAVVRAAVSSEFNGSVIDTVKRPTWAMVMRRVSVTLLVYVAHLDETVLLISIKFLCRKTVSY